MGRFLDRKDVKDALKKAKQLEKEAPLSRKEEVALYKESIEFSEKLRQLLKPAWFVKDVHKKKKPKKAAKKKKRATKKKKKR